MPYAPTGTARKVVAVDALPGFEPDRDSPDPLHRQLYRWLRQAILDGSLAPGTLLPATRRLARDCKVSRNTLVYAFEQLAAEGYIEGHIGSGTVVVGLTHSSAGKASASETPAQLRPSKRGAHLSGPHRRLPADGSSLIFEPGTPEVSEFPRAAWARLVSRWHRSLGKGTFGYGFAGGYTPLRESLAAYLAASRGVRCTPDQVLIMTSAQAALDLSTRMLTDAGDSAWLESPGYAGARAAFEGAGLSVSPIPVDDDGMHVATLAGARHRIGYVTPSHQYPTGATLALSRRLALLAWAAAVDGWIIEDDYDSEFRYAQAPLACIQGLAPAGRVIYTGSFSKALFPGLRVAYLVVPLSLVSPFRQALRQTGQEPALPVQAALNDFIEQGLFIRHIKRMRGVYAQRHAALLAALRDSLAAYGQPLERAGGLQVFFELGPRQRPEALAARAAASGFGVMPVAPTGTLHGRNGGLLFGIGVIGADPIAVSVRRLARCLAAD